MNQLRVVLLSLWISFVFVSAAAASEGIMPKGKGSYQYQLSVAAIFCDEGPYLREWIEYHKLIGARHFYLYNHLSCDNYYEVLLPYIQNGEVELFDWPYPAQNVHEWDSIQVAAYQDALEHSKSKTKWLAIIDIDEFIVPVKDNSLTAFLKKYEAKNIGGICLIWSFFGTSFVEKIPDDQLLIQTLTLNSGAAADGVISNIWNQGAYKSIVRPDLVSGTSSPHYCHYIKDRQHLMVDFELAHINHYWTRDNDFFQNVKIPRRQLWGQNVDSSIAVAAAMNKETGPSPILRFVSQLRERMGLPSGGASNL